MGKTFKNLKIMQKLLISFILVLVLASLSGIMGTILMVNSDRNYSEALIVNGFAQGEIGSFNASLNKGAALVRDIIMLTNSTDLQNTQNELSALSDLTNEQLAAVKVNCTTDKELEYISTIEQKLPEYRQLRDQVITLGLANRNDEALDMFRNQAQPVLDEIMAAAEGLADYNVTMGEEVSQSLTDNSNRMVMLNISIIIIATIVSLALAITIARSIARPISHVKDATNQLAQGDFNIDFSADTKDEVGEMVSSLSTAIDMIKACLRDISHCLGEVSKGNFDVETTATYKGDLSIIKTSIDEITQSLSVTMGQINQAADQVSVGSEQVSSGAQALAQGATEQASSIEELAATITDISEQIKGTAQHATVAKDENMKSHAEMQNCSQQMESLVAAMDVITGKSNEIGKIIKTIEDIAFQTNILALNAAVEAARAGVAGKGFAVVADEVRNLAGKSADAAQSTTQLIEETINAVADGARLSAATEESLNKVVDNAQVILDAVINISNATEEQAQSVAQVTLGVDQISNVVQTNSATAEESAAASEELSGQSQMLKALVSEFKLKN